MIVSLKQIQQAMQVYGGSRVEKNKTEKIAKTNKSDEVNISNNAQLLRLAKQAASDLPEIRGEKVAQLKQAIKCGTYDVDGEEIAEKMLGRAIVDKLV